MKNRKFEKMYGVSEKVLKEQFINMAEEANRENENEGSALIYYSESAGEVINEYHNRWKDDGVMDDVCIGAIGAAYVKGYIRIDELVYAEDRVR